jgi:hypothetical protein
MNPTSIEYTDRKDPPRAENRVMKLNELKGVVAAEEHRDYGFKVRARKAFGLPTAEVFMEMYVASFRTKDSDGWFFKTYDWWWEEHGLTKRNVQTGVGKLLEAGIIEKKNGLGNRMYFRLFPAAVIEKLYADRDLPSTQSSEMTEGQMRNASLAVLTDRDDGSNGSSLQKQQNAMSESAERTAPYKRTEEKGLEKKNVGDSPENREKDGQPDSRSLGEKVATAIFDKIKEDHDVELTQKQFGYFVGAFNRLSKKHDKDDLRVAAKKIVEIFPRFQKITVEEALQQAKFAKSMPSAGSGVPYMKRI